MDEEITNEQPSFTDSVSEVIQSQGEPETFDAATGQPVEAAKPATPAAPEVEEPDLDAELLAELPAYKHGTRQRVQGLIEKVKAASTERDEIKQQFEQVKEEHSVYAKAFEQMAELGFADDAAVADLRQFAEFRKTLHSGNLKGARDMLLSQVREISLQLGEAPQLDPLAQHQDLSEALQGQQIPQPLAYEIAQRREREQRDAQMRQQQATHHQSQQQAMQEQQQAFDKIDAISRQWETTDPDFKEIAPLLVGQVEQIVKTLPPNAWESAIRMQYTQLKEAASRWRQPPQAQTMLRNSGNPAGKPVAANFTDALQGFIGGL